MGAASDSEKRRYLRLNAAAYCRSVGLRLFSRPGGHVDPFVSRVRIWSDERYDVGDRLIVEFFPESAEPGAFRAEIAWIDELPDDAPARYDIGLRVVSLDESHKAALQSVLA